MVWVGCVGGCGREVVIKLEGDYAAREAQDEDREPYGKEKVEDWRESAQEQLVDKYAEMIITGHDGGCLWRRRGCDGKSDSQTIGHHVANMTCIDTIHRLPLAHQTTALDSLLLRYESLVEMASDLPSNLSTPHSFEIDKISQNMSRILPTRSTTPSSNAPPHSSGPKLLNREALTLALFGWQAEVSHISGLATCTACFRRLGLWLFKSPSTISDDSSPDAASMSRLDVIGEHRDYCPWVNGVSQNGNGAARRPMSSTRGLAGWEILLRVLMNAHDSTTETEKLPGPDLDGAASEVVSVTSSVAGPEGKASRDEKDQERWAKLKRLTRVLSIKKGKGKGRPVVPRPRTAG